MNPTIQRLGPEDGSILKLLAKDDADFDLSERATPRRPLTPTAARRYLANPSTLFWVARQDKAIIGFVSCHLLPLRSGSGKELLLYEIGVRTAWRRRGIGRALLAHMKAWMRRRRIDDVWVLADNPAAMKFYRACGFTLQKEQPAYLICTLGSK